MSDTSLSSLLLIILSISVSVLTAALTLVLWRLARILGHAEHLLENASRESDKIVTDIALVRRVLSGAPLMATLTAWWKKIFGAKKKRATTEHKHNNDENK